MSYVYITKRFTYKLNKEQITMKKKLIIFNYITARNTSLIIHAYCVLL